MPDNDVTLPEAPGEATGATSGPIQTPEPGGPYGGYPKSFIKRLMAGSALTRIGNEAVQGMEHGWGPEPLGEDTEKVGKFLGWFSDPDKGVPLSPLRLLNESLLYPAGTLIAGGMRAMNAGLGAGIYAGYQAWSEAEEALSNLPLPGIMGVGRPGNKKAEDSARSKFEAMDAADDRKPQAAALELSNLLLAFKGHGATITKPIHGPEGAPFDLHIGKPPEPQDFTATAHFVGGEEHAPVIEPKLKSLWEDHGIHPAEVAYDAMNDPTITADLLSENIDIPRSYTGEPVTPIHEAADELTYKSTQLQREPLWASGLTQAAEKLPQENYGSADDALNAIRNTPGVKKAEIEATGLEEWIKEQKGPVTKAQVTEFLRENQIQVSEVHRAGEGELDFQAEQEHGSDLAFLSDNIDEVSHRLDDARQGGFDESLLPDGWKFADEAGQAVHHKFVVRDQDGVVRATSESPDIAIQGGLMWLEADLVREHTERMEKAQTESAQRAGVAGKTLFPNVQLPGGEGYRELELTLPSQKGEPFEAGHFPEPNVVAHVRFNTRTGDDGSKILHVEEFQSDWAAKIHHGDAVPEMPFENNWHELAFKRMLKYAADNGYDKLTWTKGETQVVRNDVSKAVKAIHYVRTADGRYMIGVEGLEGREIPLGKGNDPISAAELEKYVGKDIADKIIKDEGRDSGGGAKELSGVDLTLGGKFHRDLYDTKIVSFANKYAGKWGTRVHDTEFTTERGKTETVHGVNITPEMKKALEGPQNLFQRAAEGERPGDAIDIAHDLWARARPSTEYTARENDLIGRLSEIAQKLFPGVDLTVFDEIGQGKYTAGGAYIRESGQRLIALALARPDVQRALMHEGIHHLRNIGALDERSWKMLTDAAEKNDWIAKYEIDKRYADATHEERVEEAVADAFAEWQRDKAAGRKLPAPLQQLFYRVELFFRSLAQSVRDILGQDATYKDVFTQIETGETGRKGTAERTPSRDTQLSEETPKDALPEEPQRLFGWVASTGRIADKDGQLAAYFDRTPGLKGHHELLDNEGMTLEEAAERAWQEGFLPEYFEKPSGQEFLAALQRDALGQRQHSMFDHEQIAAYKNALDTNRVIDGLATKYGIDKNLPHEEFWDRVLAKITEEKTKPAETAEGAKPAKPKETEPVPLEEVVGEEIEASTSAMDAGLSKIDEIAKEQAEARGEKFDKERLYDDGKPLTTEDLEREYQEDIAALGQAQSQAGAPQSGPAGGGQAGGQVGAGPVGGGAGAPGSVVAGHTGGAGSVPPSPAGGSGGAGGGVTPEQRILGRYSINGKPRVHLSFRELYRAAIDELDPIRVARQIMTDGRGVPTHLDPFRLARLTRGNFGRAEVMIMNQTYDWATHAKTGIGLKGVLETLVDRKLTDTAGNPIDAIDALRVYWGAKRDVDLTARGFKPNFDPTDAQATVNHYAAELQPIVDEGVAYQNRVLKYLKDSGVLSDDAFNAMVSAGQNYVPFYRLLENNDSIGPSGAGAGIMGRQPIRRYKGSDKDIIDPLESIIKNTFLYVSLAEKNAVVEAYVNLAKANPGKVMLEGAPPAALRVQISDAEMTKFLTSHGIVNAPNDLLEVFRSYSTPIKPDQIAVFDQGKRNVYHVDTVIGEAFQGLDRESANTLEKIFAAPARLLRAGSTLTPDFMIRNLFRDLLTAGVTTGGTIFHLGDTIKGMNAERQFYFDPRKINQSRPLPETYWNWKKSGGANAAMVSLDRRYIQTNVQDVIRPDGLPSRLWNSVSHPIDHLRMASEFAENATRLGEFIKVRDDLIKRGFSEKEANFESGFSSREVTLDFARMGTNMRVYNMVTAFANAAVQGSDRIVRAFIDNPGRTSFRVGAGIMAPSALLWMVNHADPVYQQLPQWQKDVTWPIIIHRWKDGARDARPDYLQRQLENGHTQVDDPLVLKIPKPFELGVLFGTGTERALAAIFDHNPEAFDKFFDSVQNAMLPSFYPTAAAPIIEQFANRSTFTDRPIVTASREKLLPEYQYTPYTTEIAKALAKILSDMPGLREGRLKEGTGLMGGFAKAVTNPILIEQYVRDWTGGLGNYALQIADAGLRKAGVLPDPPKPADKLADIPFVKAFFARYPSSDMESIQKFHDKFTLNLKFYDTFQALAKEGDIEATKRIRSLGGDRIFVDLKGIKQALDNQSNFVRMVYKNPKIGDEEKRQMIDQSYYSMLQISTAGNNIIRALDAAIKAKAPE